MAEITQFNYEVSQSVTGSFRQGDTVEFTFQAQATSNISRNAEQKVNLFYSTDSESISYVQVADFPKTFGIGTSYATKSFATTPTEDWQAVKAIITGSIATSSTNFGGTAGAIAQIDVDYDDWQITSYVPKSELTDEGLMVFRSPSRFIKVDKDGVQVKAGTLQAEKLIAEELEVFGDVTVFGDFQASPIPPYDGTITDIGSADSTVGSSTDYARGDHKHDLPFETLNTVAGEGTITDLDATSVTASIVSASTIVNDTIKDFTKLSGSIGATGSFGHLEVMGEAGNAGHIYIMDSDSDTNHINDAFRISKDGDGARIVNMDSGYIRLGLGGSVSPGKLIITPNGIGVDTDTITEAVTISGSISVVGETGHITASGQISSSGTGTNYFGGNVNVSGSVILQGSGLVVENDSSTELTFTGTNNTNITSQGDLYIKAGSSKKMYLGADGTSDSNDITIDTNGFVGIGNTSPFYNLDLGDNSTSQIRAHRFRTNNGNLDSSGADLRITSTADLQIDATNVGIGETNPVYKLDVDGDIRAKGDIIAERYIVSSSITHLTQSFSSGSTMFGDTLDDTHLFTGSINTTGSFNINGNILVKSSGTYPTYKSLNIYGNDIYEAHISHKTALGSSYGSNGMIIFDTDAGGLYADGTTHQKFVKIRPTITQTVGAGHTILEIDTDEDSLGTGDKYLLDVKRSGTSQFVISSSGQVGIGTTTPSNLLHLYESGSNDYQLKIYQTGSDASPGSAGIFFSANNDYGQDGYIRINDNGFYFGTTDNEDIIFTPGDNEVLRLGDDSGTNIADVFFHGTSSPTLFVSESGKVGIGVKTPSSSLTVGGDITFDTYYDGSANRKLIWPSSGGGLADNYIDYSNWVTSATGGKLISNVTGIIKLESKNVSNGLVLSGSSVGIGTSSPGSLLPNIFNSNTPKLLEISSSTTSTDVGLLLRRSDGATGLDIWSDNSNGIMYIDSRYNSSAGDINFRVRTDTRVSNNLATVMTITGDERVGIKTTTPSKALEVAGDISSSGNLYLGGASPHIDLTGTSGDMYVKFNDTDSDTYSIGFDNGDSTFAISTGSGLSGNHALDIDSSGNVGIGTTSPQEKLQVDGNISSSHITSSGNLVPAGHTTSAGDIGRPNHYWNKIRTHEAEIFNNGTNRLSVQSEYVDIGGGNFYVKSTGEVGIGTSTPTKKLEVDGDISASGDIYLQNNKGIQIQESGGTLRDLIKLNSSNEVEIGSSALSTDILFRNTGNVGIKTTTPSQQLEVEGSISASGNIFLDDNGYLALDTSNSNNKAYIGNQGSNVSQISMMVGGHGNSYTRLLVHDNGIVVKNDISASGNIYLNGTSTIGTSNASDGIKVDPQGNLELGTVGTDDIKIGRTDGKNKVAIQVGSANTFVVSGSNVGIGESTPVRQLDLSNSSNAIMSIRAGNTANAGIYFYDGTSEMFDLQYKNSDDKFYIVSSADDTNGITIDRGDGNVGIGITSPAERLDVGGNIKTTGNISSPSFFSGFAGSGFRITSASAEDGKYALTLDNLTVRGQMSVYELLVQQVRATNGSLWVSSTGKVDSVVVGSAPSFSLSFDTGSNTYGHGFREGDLIRAQRYQGEDSFQSNLEVINIGNSGSLIAILDASSTPPSGGFDYVRIGNTTSASRQGAVYMTADDESAPYIDVIDKITAHSEFNSSGKVKTRIGKLDGITTSTRFGTLSGYGFYASGSAFLEGSINATSGTIGDFIIDDLEIRDSGNDLRLKSTGQITASKALIQGNSKIAGWDVTDELIQGANISLDAVNSRIYKTNDEENYHIDFTPASEGNAYYVKFGPNFSVSSSGQLIASGAVIEGVLTSSEGRIGGFNITSQSLFSTGNEVVLDSANHQISLKTSTFGNAGVQLSASGDFHMGDSSRFITLQNDSLGIKTDTFNLDTSTFDVTTDEGGRVNLGTGIQLSGSGGGYVANQSMSWDKDGNLKITGSIQLTSGDVSASIATLTLDSASFATDISEVSGGTVTNASSITQQSDSITLLVTSASDAGNLMINSQGVTISGSKLEFSGSKFIFGNEAETFISGSDSKLEISASGFHLKPTGDAILSGSITANQGTIAGFGIVGDTISKGNLTLDSANEQIKLGGSAGASSTTGIFLDSDGTFNFATDTNNYIRKSGTDLEIKSQNTFLSGSNVNILTPSFFLGSSTNNISSSNDDLSITTKNLTASGSSVELLTPNFFLGNLGTSFISSSTSQIEISSSNFHLKEGNITASNVDLSGKISADSGDIGGFKIDTDGINSTNSVFQITGSTGQLTASKVLLEGGEIGGFGITASHISASNLLLKSSGQITASNVLLDGGTIAGLVISESFGGSLIGGSGTLRIKADGGNGHSHISASKALITGRINANAGTFTNEIVVGQGLGGGYNDGHIKVGYAPNAIIISGSHSDSGSRIHSGVGEFSSSNTGFYMDASGNFSLGDKLSWDGNNLAVEGSITITSGNAATTESVSQSIDTATGSLLPLDSTGSMLAVATASLLESSKTGSMLAIATASLLESSKTGSMLALATESLVDNSQTGSFHTNATQFSFGADELVLEAGDAAVGLNLNSQYMGFYDGTNFSAYIDSSGNFYLGGASTGSLQWNNSAKSLNISGSAVRMIVPEFVLGDKFSQYISGSNSNIEISSSNFHLSPDGNVTMSGEITAEAGHIAGWEITGSSIQTGSGFFGVQLDHEEGLIGRGQEAHEFLGGVANFYFSPTGDVIPPNFPDSSE